jgi:hypothetical protein
MDSQTCIGKDCKEKGRQAGLSFPDKNGQRMCLFVDRYYCPLHVRQVGVDSLLGNDGWSFVCNHLTAEGLGVPVKNQCQVILFQE